MITLVPMTADDYEVYKEQSIPEYAKDMIAAGNTPEDKALAVARQSFEGGMPDGFGMAGHYVNFIQDGEVRVGVIWYAEHPRIPNTVFIYDILIYPDHRRKGYAKQAFALVEQHARELGKSRIGLHVFGHNTNARALYHQLGFVETNVNMAKRLE